MKRFGRILIATAGLAVAATPAIFARDFHDAVHYDRHDRVVVVRPDHHDTDCRYDRFDYRNWR